MGISVTPADFVSLAVSAAYNNCGFDMGAALSLRVPGFANLFVAADKIPLYWNNRMFKVPIPTRSGLTNVTAGLVFAF